MSQISVIIPTLNSPLIKQTLTALRKQNFDLTRVEVLVVGLDEMSLVEADSVVRLISVGRATPAHNRNIGIRHAKGRILCFVDADCVPEPDWLSCLISRYADPQIFVVGGSVTFDVADYWTACDNLSWFSQSLSTAPAGVRNELPTLNLSIRREVVDRVGLFDERYITGEDIEWTTRIRHDGYPLHFEPRAIVKHRAKRNTVNQLVHHAYQFGRYSPKINPINQASLSTEKRLLPKQWWLLFLLTPLFSFMSTLRIVLTHRTQSLVWKAIPGIWLSKAAWCLGAVQTLKVQSPSHI